MSEELKRLVDASRSVVMSDRDREQQRRSFAFGNTHFENDIITRGTVDDEADKLRAGEPSSDD